MTTSVEPAAGTSFVPILGAVTTSARLNVRRGSPHTTAPVAAKVAAGTVLAVRGMVRGENVLGNTDWYSGVDDTYFWSGATRGFEPHADDGSPPPVVTRRANGTIKALGDQQIRAIFGDVAHTELSGDRVSLDATWVAHNIVDVATPMLAGAGFDDPRPLQGRRRISSRSRGDRDGRARRADRHLRRRVPTRRKGWDPTEASTRTPGGSRSTSMHSGTATASRLAPVGTYGTVRELVRIFEAQGFAWGGHFQPDTARGGMHFELARLDL